jgi:hypothetical protein
VDALTLACSREIGAALLRQEALVHLLHDLPWNLDLETGTITFGPGTHVFPVGLLGSESDSDKSWLWAWANLAENVDLLVWPQFNVPSDAGALPMAMVFGGLAGDLPVYRGPYDGGAVFLTLHDVPINVEELSPVVLPRLLHTLTFLDLPLDKTTAVTGLFQAYGWTAQVTDGQVVGRSIAEDPDTITVTIDHLDRITGVEALLHGANAT